MSVNVGVGECVVGGSEGGAQGGYYAKNSALVNLSIAAANATNPRIDTVCVTISDGGYTEPTGGSGNQVAAQVVTGTPTSGATLVNLNGAAALPLSSLLLGYVLVPATSTNVTAGNIANVAKVAVLGPPSPSGFVAGLTFTPNTTTSYANVSATGVTIQCTGQPILVQAGPISVQLTSAPAYNCLFGFSVDGAAAVSAGIVGINGTGGQNTIQPFTPTIVLTPSAGSHTITLQQRLDAAGAGVTFATYVGQVIATQL